MTESFDDFARKHASDKDDRTRLRSETKAEWEILKGLVSQFAIDGKGIGNRQFTWQTSITGRPMLVLENVAALFLDDGERAGVPQNTRVRLTRRPAGHGQVYIDDPPLEDITWGMEPGIKNGEFIWFVPEKTRHYSATEIAEEIAKELAQYHIAYENAFGREL